MYLGVIRSSPTAYSKVTIQQINLNRKNVNQNEKYKCKNNIKLTYLTFIHCRNKQTTELNCSLNLTNENKDDD